MKRKGLIVIGYLVIFALLIGLAAMFALPILQWNKLPEIPMNIWVVDKTVPTPDAREHRGLFWVLESKKIVDKETGKAFRFDKDYYGFFPINKDDFKTKELPTGVLYPDFIYLADTYGVYQNDYFSANVEGARSELLYGGLNSEDVTSIQANLGGGNTLIGEFNTASSPTNLANRERLGQLFHVSWSGWSGRFFQDLSKGVEVPNWAVQDYETRTGTDWNFSGQGLLLVADDSRVVVLEKGKEVGKQELYLRFEEKYQGEFGIDKSVPYEYWFEFVIPDAATETLASYQLDLTEEGKVTFQKLGLPQSFPAMIRSQSKEFTSYYFAGDFADGKYSEKLAHVNGYDKWKSIFNFGIQGDNSKFYWRCYVPLMQKILKDVALHQKS